MDKIVPFTIDRGPIKCLRRRGNAVNTVSSYFGDEVLWNVLHKGIWNIKTVDCIYMRLKVSWTESCDAEEKFCVIFKASS